MSEMSHSQPHPEAGQYFRVILSDGNDQAIYDRGLQDNLIRLVDWADRIEQHDKYTKRQIELALSFYAHRCLPDREPTDERARRFD